jgi:multiple sugar transport system permease protein
MRVRSAEARAVVRGLAWVSPWMAGFIVFFLVPIGLSLYYSLTDYTLLEGPVFIGVDNYRELAGDAMFVIAVRNTLVFACGSVIGSTLISIALAMLLERPLRFAGLVRAIVRAGGVGIGVLSVDLQRPIRSGEQRAGEGGI